MKKTGLYFLIAAISMVSIFLFGCLSGASTPAPETGESIAGAELNEIDSVSADLNSASDIASSADIDLNISDLP